MDGNLDDQIEPHRRAVLPGPIVRGRIIGIGRRLDPATLPAVAEALVESGIGALEVTLDSSGRLEAIALLASRFRPEDLIVGAGTVTTVAAAKTARDAGTGFIVTPVCHLGVVRWAIENGLPIVPGAFTPTEMLAAWRAGATAVKLFPASALGPDFVRDVRGPMPEIPAIPTGGVTLDNAAAFLSAGAVGVGSWLTGPGDIELVRQGAVSLVASIRQDSAA